MPLMIESYDSLPYIDAPPTTSERAAIEALIIAELGPTDTSTPHPQLPTLPSLNFTPLTQAELDRVSAQIPLTAIDLSRYEAPSPSDTSDSAAQRQALQTAYTLAGHLSIRHKNLALLEQFGKNAWVIHCSQLEEILRGLERELAEMQAETEAVNRARKAAQEGVRAQLEGLEAAWREGVGRIVEVELAVEGLRRKIRGLN
ncbi:hypothetical protein MMC12_002572 [Toensbergia leucococca]|nr:hypothetical protein [Toensbergia leucococca]